MISHTKGWQNDQVYEFFSRNKICVPCRYCICEVCDTLIRVGVSGVCYLKCRRWGRHFSSLKLVWTQTLLAGRGRVCGVLALEYWNAADGVDEGKSITSANQHLNSTNDRK